MVTCSATKTWDCNVPISGMPYLQYLALDGKLRHTNGTSRAQTCVPSPTSPLQIPHISRPCTVCDMEIWVRNSQHRMCMTFEWIATPWGRFWWQISQHRWSIPLIGAWYEPLSLQCNTSAYMDYSFFFNFILFLYSKIFYLLFISYYLIFFSSCLLFCLNTTHGAPNRFLLYR